MARKGKRPQYAGRHRVDSAGGRPGDDLQKTSYETPPESDHLREISTMAVTYDRTSRLLHWLVAALVLVQFATGWSWGYFPRMLPVRR